MPKFTLDKLNRMYRNSKHCDERTFAEQRTNILLRSGDHYNRKAKSTDDLRSKGSVNRQEKIRLVKNHIHRITNLFINSILEGNPSIEATPFNDNELSDVKNAEMSNSVLRWVKDTNDWSRKQEKLVHDFIVIGETWAKIRFDYNKGPIVAQDEKGEPVRAGEFVIDRVFAFDLKRDPTAREASECQWWIHEQMVDIDELKDTVKKLSPENVEKLTPSVAKANYKIFDGNSGSYGDMKNQVAVRELFYKPSSRYPKGYFVMFVDEFIITEGELPFGIFPLVGEGFDEMTTSPRHTSIIKVCRPYQVEINRASSKQAEHQITLGDDKVFIQKGTKLSSGGLLNGVRAIQYTGAMPIIQPGRTGEHLAPYGQAQVAEMYEACGLSSILEDKVPQAGDPFQLLFRSMKEKKRFVKYVGKYERFEVDLFSKVIQMAKAYLDDGHMIKIAGRSEAVNIPEFRRMDDSGFQIKVIPQSGDVETKFGKILSLTQVMQYAGSSLSPDQLGNVIRELPTGNKEQAFSSLTADSDNAKNDILAMDRGEPVPINPHDNHQFYIQSLTHRIKKSDFRFLEPQVQDLYFQKLAQHELALQQQQQAIQQQSMGMIPSGGFLTTVNASWNNPATGRVERIKVPSEAVKWLVDKLNGQGAFASQMAALPPQSQANVAGGAPEEESSLPPISQSQTEGATTAAVSQGE
jgi:hypothetical protein